MSLCALSLSLSLRSRTSTADAVPPSQIPWFETPVIYDVRSKPRSIASLTGTKGASALLGLLPPRLIGKLTHLSCSCADLQMVNITCRVLCRPRVDALAKIYTELGTNYDEVVLPSIVNEVLKSVVAQFNASCVLLSLGSARLGTALTSASPPARSQLVTQREMVSKLVRDNLERRASRFNLILDDVSITHVTFSPAFSEAVEAKQIAQQTAQRAAYLVDQALQEKQSIIVKAQGEARSAELIGDAVKQNKGCVVVLGSRARPSPSPSRSERARADLARAPAPHRFLELRKMEAAREIAGLVSNSGNKLMLDSDALLLNRASLSLPSLSPFLRSRSVADAPRLDVLQCRRATGSTLRGSRALALVYYHLPPLSSSRATRQFSHLSRARSRRSRSVRYSLLSLSYRSRSRSLGHRRTRTKRWGGRSRLGSR